MDWELVNLLFKDAANSIHNRLSQWQPIVYWRAKQQKKYYSKWTSKSTILLSFIL